MLAHGARVAAGACRACVPHLSELSDFCARGAPVGYATSAARGLCTTWPAQATGPDATVYSGPTTADRKRVTLRHIRKKYLEGGKLSMVTAYDYPSAKHVRKRRSHHRCRLTGLLNVSVCLPPRAHVHRRRPCHAYP